MNRTQIYLSESQHDALVALAAARSTTASSLIRDAIDGYLAAQLSPRDRVDALRSLAARIAIAAQPSDSVAIVESLRSADADRLRFSE